MLRWLLKAGNLNVIGISVLVNANHYHGLHEFPRKTSLKEDILKQNFIHLVTAAHSNNGATTQKQQ